MSIFKKVEYFNKNIIGIDRMGPQELDKKELDWLVGALTEEIEELKTAHRRHDFVDQIDAIIDLIYFAAGALTRMGIDSETSEKIFDAVHGCNMRKIKGTKLRVVKSELDAIKPAEWQSPEIAIMKILKNCRG
jgi:predicted HAD superfamily Cof-like phosphohydrolase